MQTAKDAASYEHSRKSADLLAFRYPVCNSRAVLAQLHWTVKSHARRLQVQCHRVLRLGNTDMIANATVPTKHRQLRSDIAGETQIPACSAEPQITSIFQLS